MHRPAVADARPLLAAILAALALIGVVPARAAEDFVSQLQTVAEIRFRGREQVPPRELRRALRTRTPSIWPWADEVPFRLDFLNADTAALRAAYQERGFLDAGVDSVHVTPAPNRQRPQVIVTYFLTEGRRSFVRAVHVTGNEHYPAEALRKKLFARPGRPFNPGYLGADTARISQAYQDRGYRPTVAAEAVRDSADPLNVRVTYHVVEGALYHFGQIYLSSPTEIHVQEQLIRREFVVHPGDVYRTSKVDQSLQRLYETGLFSQVHISALPDSTNAEVELDLRVRERKPRWIDAGVGSATSERFRFIGEWGHRNIWGHGIQGSVGGQLSIDGKGRFLRARGESSVLEPWIFRTRTRALATIYRESGLDRTDTSWVRHYNAQGVSFQLRRDLALRTQIFLLQDNTYVDQSFDLAPTADSVAIAHLDPVTGDVPRRYSTHRLQLGYEGDLRDNPVNPVVGSMLTANAQIAGGPLGGRTYVFTKTQVVGSRHRPVGTRGWTFGWRVGGGIVRPFGKVVGFTPDSVDADVNRVPSDDRFRLGGVNSIRGYVENEITPVGGLVMLLGNAELRVPVYGPLGLEAFVDGGNVWSRPNYLKASNFVPRATRVPRDQGDLRYVLGVGGRLILPFGPLRVDFTWNLQPDLRSGASRWLVAEPQFAIGPSF